VTARPGLAVAPVLAAAALAGAVLTTVAVTATTAERLVAAIALAPLAIALLAIGLGTGRVGVAAFGDGVLAVLAVSALLGGPTSIATTTLVVGGVWLTTLTTAGSLLARVDRVDPTVAASMVRWALGVTGAGLGLAATAEWAAGELPERTFGPEALAAVSAVVVVVVLATAATHREEPR
jgi:hypothetical protein